MIAKGIKKDINIVDIFKFNFLIPFIVAVLLHTLWDTGIVSSKIIPSSVTNIKMYICAFIAFGIVLYYVREGIVQIFTLKNNITE
ncbi:hypothetical protein L1O48_04550 [Ligilactobacillus equi]